MWARIFYDLPKEALRGRAGVRRWKERTGYVCPSVNRTALFYCDGIGELRTLLPLFKKLSGGLGGVEPVIMAYGKDAYGLAKKSLFPGTRVVHSPYYCKEAARRSFLRLNAGSLVIVESDYSPVYIGAARDLGLETAVLNVSFSHWKDKEMHGLGAEGFREMLAGCDLVTFKHHSVRDAITGAIVPANMGTTGNLRYAAMSEKQAVSDPHLRGLLQRASEQAFIFVAGSTYEEEEKVLLEALGGFLKAGKLKLVMAPRKAWRAKRTLNQALSSGLTAVKRSAADGLADLPQVTVLDTFGELAGIYGYAHAAFVGGTIRRKGGHNLFEPAACGVPVLFGPDYGNNFDFAEELLARHGGFCIKSAAEIKHHVSKWMAKPEERRTAGKAAEAALERSEEVLGKTAAALQKLVSGGSHA